MQIVTSAVRGCCVNIREGGAPSLLQPNLYCVEHWCFLSTLMHRVCVLLEHALCLRRCGLTSFDSFQWPDAFEISSFAHPRLLQIVGCQT